MNNNKAQVFLFDLIFSFVIIVVSLGIFFTYFTTTEDNEDIHSLNKEILERFTTTNINALNNEEVRLMFTNNQITNIENTVAQQVGEFFYLGETQLARELTGIFARSFVSNEMNVIIDISNTTSSLKLYNNTIRINQSESSIASSLRRDILGFFNQEEVYGPYTVNVSIWI